jgi:hypothetical protein
MNGLTGPLVTAVDEGAEGEYGRGTDFRKRILKLEKPDNN